MMKLRLLDVVYGVDFEKALGGLNGERSSAAFFVPQPRRLPPPAICVEGRF
jgi:hypothetical protein